jgi:hypothetical protein
MKENNQSWYTCNGLTTDNLPTITLLLSHYNMISCKEIINNGNDSLLITCKLNTYLVNVNKFKNRLELWQRNKAKNPINLESYHNKMVTFESDDAWFELINWIRGMNNV